MLRRTFLLGATATLAALSQEPRKSTRQFGSLAWIQNGALWIRRLPDGSPRALAAGNRLNSPKFSPSGRWILFQESAGEAPLLRLVSADGAQSKSWTNEGRWLPGRDTLLLDDKSVLGESNDWSAPLKTFTDPVGTISPDGARHVWTVSDETGTRLLAGPLDGRSDPQLVAETKEGGFQILSYVLGGSRFLYWMTDEEGADVWSYGMDLYMGGGAAPFKIGLSTLPDNDEWQMASLSPAANVLAVATGDDHIMTNGHRLVLATLTADAAATIRPVTKPQVTVRDPAWSPDGQTLAWVQGPDSEVIGDQLFDSGRAKVWSDVWDYCARRRRIWSAGNEGMGPPFQLTNESGFSDEMPIWSRDGKSILFVRYGQQDERSIWLMRADGSDAAEVAPLSKPADVLPLASLFDWSFR